MGGWLLAAIAATACTAPGTDRNPDGTDTTDPTDTSPTPTTATTATVEGLDFGPGGAPRNLLVISVDTTRRDHLGRYDGSDTTPFLDGWLAQAVVLDDHRSCSSWTGPSMMCATTGRSPLDVGVQTPSAAREQLDSVAELLSRQGYATRAVSANPYFFNRTQALGFDTVEARDVPAEQVAARGLEVADELLAATAPWYLHLHFFDPHREYCPPEAYRTHLDELPAIPYDLCRRLDAAQTVLYEAGSDEQRANFLAHVDAMYRAEIRYTDHVLAQLWSDLEARGALDDTLVVFFTDHGEQLLERGAIDHGTALFAEENKAVAAFWAPGLAPAVVSTPTQHEDIAATLFDVFGVASAFPIRGFALGTAPQGRALAVVNRTDTIQLAVLLEGRQLSYAFDGTRSFHHDDTDPAHLEDRYSAVDPEVVRLWEVLAPIVESARTTFEAAGDPVRPRP